jgi:hypothetical protein
MGSGLPESKNRPWRLILRSHDLGGTDYETIAFLTDELAEEIVDVSKYKVTWLYGPPDWDERAKKRALEKARVLREQADKIEADVKETFK